MSIQQFKEIRKGQICAFINGEEFNESIEKIYLCDLELPTGKIAIGDGFAMDGYEVLNKEVIPGKYPVYLYIHHINQDQRVSFVEVRFNEKVPTVYKNAIKTTNKAGEVIGYQIYNELACVMDKSVADYLQSLSENEMINVWNEMNKKSQYQDTYSIINHGNIVAFSSGFGDGVYGAYFGCDRLGKICSLVTDFRTIISTADMQRTIDWGKAYDKGSNHCYKKKEMKLDVEDLAGYNHIAAFLRWMVEHNLMSSQLLSLYPDLPKIVSEKKVDLREIIDTHPIFNGAIKRMHFNEIGRTFANDFYLFRMHSEEGYPRCTDIHAENYFGTERYNSEEFKDEAYLFVPYDEAYYKGLSEFIDRAWERFINEYEG